MPSRHAQMDGGRGRVVVEEDKEEWNGGERRRDEVRKRGK